VGNSEQIQYRAWTIEVQRKAFRRSISIVLRPGRPIQVRAAMLTPLRTICEFIESRHLWITKNLTKFQEQEKDLPQLKLESGGKYPFFGRMLELKPVPTQLNRVFISATDEHLLLHLPENLYREKAVDLTFAHEAIRNFYRRETAKDLKARAEHWARETGLQPTKISVREARTRWGSCNPRGHISLNWRLGVYRPEVIDYVIVHELSHLKHMNHSKHFWDLVERLIPGSQVLAKEIKDSHRLSDFLEVR
jgi:hypothetical protein